SPMYLPFRQGKPFLSLRQVPNPGDRSCETASAFRGRRVFPTTASPAESSQSVVGSRRHDPPTDTPESRPHPRSPREVPPRFRLLSFYPLRWGRVTQNIPLFQPPNQVRELPRRMASRRTALLNSNNESPT